MKFMKDSNGTKLMMLGRVENKNQGKFSHEMNFWRVMNDVWLGLA
jgi:hypothetical protein